MTHFFSIKVSLILKSGTQWCVALIWWLAKKYVLFQEKILNIIVWVKEVSIVQGWSSANIISSKKSDGFVRTLI